MIETYKKLDQILNNSLEQLNGFMCSRACCYDYGDDIKTSPHSYVNINKFIFEGSKFTEESIGKFENDIEHGVFHGVMTYLISTILDENINKNLKHDILEYHEHKVRAENDSNVFLNKRFEVSLDCYNNELDKFKIIPSCIFHDAYRVMIHHDNHDLKLKQYFPNLLNETYHHTNPYGVYETSLIVRSDRIELYTESYASSSVLDFDKAIEPFVKAANKANELGIGINAGHDLNLENLKFFATNIQNLKEVSIGHALISDALNYGMENTVNLYLRALLK